MAHTLIHTNTRNRLKVRPVNILLFCYVNLWLLNKDNTKIGKFLGEVILNEEIETMMAEDDGINLDAGDISINNSDEDDLGSNVSG